jgi:nicotinamide riboside kinase
MNIRLIAMTGAESTGKTTLAEALAQALPGQLVTEASRDLLAPGAVYDLDDVVAIGREQNRRENTALQSTRGWVVADTDLLVIRIWLQERFQVWPETMSQLWNLQTPRIWILTAPDIPWEPDPLRENPHDRERLHALYRQYLSASQTPWVEVSGSVGSRLQQVLRFVSELG